ncbi:TRAP transporter large permease subunit [Vulcanococcus sp. CPBay_Sum15L08_68]|uniref:TRAP transporter large permease n=1 Tax=Vulcanococcus sp. CPBay_Sum15L08_68 TaxID=2806295 RepID=UPI0025FA5BEF|nr:TRAP transporter large permease subunit [Vulcanococcus sp. CPBay_Sum15L08_68]MDA1156836.1 TRAP transporter large permease subunit [Cyanobacteriota bacterium]
MELEAFGYVITFFPGEVLGPAMFIALVLALLSGYPVAFGLGGISVLFALLGMAVGVIEPQFLTALPQRIFGIMSNFTLLAIPAFVFMGAMLERSGIAERLLVAMGQLLRGVRGGLALAVVLVGALLAATTGVVAATVTTMGLISLPVMLRAGYDRSLATGVIAASGTLGQIIPPSIVLVVLGDQLGVSVGDLFLGALIPGVLMTAGFALYVLVISSLKPELAPALNAEADSSQPSGRALLKVLLPPLGLILLVLGSIFFGLATPTEAGAIGAIGAMALAALEGGLNRRGLNQVCDDTLRTTAMVMAILLGSTAFSLVFRGVGGDQLISDLLLNLPGGKAGFLLVSMAVIFALGFFIDFFEIAFIVLPLLLPSARQLLGPEALLWFGVLIGANLQTSFLSPPFGFALFFLRGVAPEEVSTQSIYRGAWPFIGVQLAVLLLIVCFPPLVNWLPSMLRV